MGDIRNGMKTISGNEPTAAQIARVTSIAHDFDIPKNDALFPLFVALDQYHGVFSCRIPDDCIDSKRYPLFMARDVMRVLIEQLQAEGATPS